MDEVTITLADEDGTVSPDALIAALENTIAGLKALEPKLLVKYEAIKWKIVHASMNSPMTISLRPIGKKREVAKARKAAKVFIDGVRAIATNPSRPVYFDDAALEAASKLGGTADGRGRITIQIPGELPVTPPESVRTNAKLVMASSGTGTYQEAGSIEGQLDNILTHDGLGLQIWETFTNIKIDCIVSAPQIEEAKKYLQRRVSVSGLVKYRHDKPVSIKVHDFKPLRERHELPQREDFAGFNITGDLLPEEYIRAGRDE